MLPLFGDADETVLPLAAKLRDKLSNLAAEGVLIGGSSWKYEGWIGQIYDRGKYTVRGRVSRRKFEQECLAEYATIFPIVCGDFSFYQFPSEAFWRKMFTATPTSFRFALKVPEEVTAKHWPRHRRYGPRAGMANENFLNAAVLDAAFLSALRPYEDRIAILILEFGAFTRPSLTEFRERLATFLDALPPNFRYAVEVRNPEYLDTEYFSLLAAQGVAHVFNAWTRMPTLAAQVELPGAHTAGISVVRALLRQGRPYEQAVEMFQPYTHVQDPNPEGREAIRRIIERARREKKASYIFVNNRFEGNAPETIEAVVDSL